MIYIKKIQLVFGLLFFSILFSQVKSLKNNSLSKKYSGGKIAQSKKSQISLPKFYENVPLLIPKKKDGKFGFVNQKGQFVVAPQYHLVMFFAEDCNLLSSPNEKVRTFGTSDFATVEKNQISYRINRGGKIVYQYKDSDLGICRKEVQKPLFHAYILKGKYGIIEDARFKNPNNRDEFTIYPDYQYLYILESDDKANPMIIATYNDKFGVIDIHNKIVIPFEYNDIKRNYSWKLGNMFEVTKDDKNYYFIDSDNRTY